jgi:RNase H-like domain found in reverse transcriptase
MDLTKVKTVQKWLIPKTVIKVQEFIRFANFYQRFIKRYSGIATPFTNLIKKDKVFSWTKNE